MPAWVIPAMSLGANIVKGLMGGNRVKTGAIDPSQHRDLFQPNVNMIRQQAARSASMQTMPAVSNIRRMAAAGGMPAGAAMAGMQGAAYRGAQAASGIEPQLAQMQQQGDLNYFNAMNQYSMGQAQAGNIEQQARMGDLGSMAKIAMLWQAGYFDKPEGESEAMAGRSQGTPGVGGYPGLSLDTIKRYGF